MAKLKDGVISSWNGVVDAEMKDGEFYAYVKTDEQVREMALELVRALETKIEVHKAILTGQYAKGCADEWDGIDVVIVSPNFEGLNSLDRISLISELMVRGGVHHLVEVTGKFTPDEYLNPDPRHTPMLGWSRYRGKVIYDKDAG